MATLARVSKPIHPFEQIRKIVGDCFVNLTNDQPALRDFVGVGQVVFFEVSSSLYNPLK